MLSLLEQGPEAVIATYNKVDCLYRDDVVLTSVWTLVIKDAEADTPNPIGDIFAQVEGNFRRFEQDIKALKQAARAMCGAPSVSADWFEIAIDVLCGLWGTPAEINERFVLRHKDDNDWAVEP